MIVDTHIHVWDLSKAEYAWLDGNTTLLNRTYYLHEIEKERKQVDITSGVLVQAAPVKTIEKNFIANANTFYSLKEESV